MLIKLEKIIQIICYYCRLTETAKQFKRYIATLSIVRYFRLRCARRQEKLLFEASHDGTIPPTFPGLVSQLCTVEQMDTPMYRRRCDDLKLTESIRHRKTWEFCYVMQALEEQIGMLSAGTGLRGLGFGVGKEQLSAAFAARGCEIVATDQARDSAERQGWVNTSQHAESLAELNELGLCPADIFKRRVTFREVDMNHIPNDLRDFDFCWSCCSLEHIGSIAQGNKFVLASVRCLKPGGVAVHTTEYNLTSNDRTVDHQDTVLFRKRDLLSLKDDLQRDGCSMLPLNLNPGIDPINHHVDIPPYQQTPHLRLLLWSYTTTSVGYIIRRER